MQRVGFVLKVKADRLEEYQRRHREVWPDMLQALRETGWHNYSLFMRDDGLLPDPPLLGKAGEGTDLIYHHFGPYSWEMQDALVRLDRQIAICSPPRRRRPAAARTCWWCSPRTTVARRCPRSGSPRGERHAGEALGAQAGAGPGAPTRLRSAAACSASSIATCS